jgi:CheY-like chemotaxis protein
MSHELRTPLNSLLILSDQLSKNPEGNLSTRQTEYAKTIHSSGNDLLMLINDILDLSKIESGTVVLDVGELRFADLHLYVERTFRHVAEQKGVAFAVDIDPTLPRALTTDTKRLQQIIKNLLSNAFKFTHHGQVRLNVELAHEGWHSDNETLNASDPVLVFTVTDTGIGIPLEKQQIIFEAFQQADGSTSRKYGGTGLGLAISRETARLLGGEIRLMSTPDVGSEFSLYLPLTYTPQKVVRRALSPAPKPPATAPVTESVDAIASQDDLATATVDPEPARDDFGDDRRVIQPDDFALLIVDNDTEFSSFVLETAHKLGFKGLVTASGAAAIALAGEYQPHAVLLDISLPDIDGWRVLKRLKSDSSLRHIPVYVCSTVDRPERGLKLGAQGVLQKPIQTVAALEQFLNQLHLSAMRSHRRILVVDADQSRREELLQLLNWSGVEVNAVEGGAAALESLRATDVDCVVLTPDPGDMSLASLAEQLLAEEAGAAQLVLYVAPNTPDEYLQRLARLSQEFHLRLVNSPPRLVDELAMLLCQPVPKLPDDRQAMVRAVRDSAAILEGKRVLIVDDDIRNIFALTSVLERFEMVTVSAETGRDAINLLQAAPEVDIVLMDIMMPEMDGIDTTRAIRQIPRFKELPIVAVTAKAMVGDREKCIEAGAWDYLSKPVDPEHMLSVLRAWLSP